MELSELNLNEDQLANVQKLIQSETDKVRTDYSAKLKTVKDELVQLKPADKSDVEIALENKQKELEQKELELANKEKGYQVKEKLANAGLPIALANYLNVGDDVDTLITEVGGTLNTYFLDNGFKPKNHTKNEGTTKKDFKNMTYSERVKLFDTNPELYKKLSN